MIWAYTDQHLLGRAAPMATQFHKTTDEEYEERLRNLARFVSACTLGLWSFAGPTNRDLLSVLTSVAGAVSDGGPFLCARCVSISGEKNTDDA